MSERSLHDYLQFQVSSRSRHILVQRGSGATEIFFAAWKISRYHSCVASLEHPTTRDCDEDRYRMTRNSGGSHQIGSCSIAVPGSVAVGQRLLSLWAQASAAKCGSPPKLWGSCRWVERFHLYPKRS